MPLITIELAYGSSFELQEGDSDILVRLEGQDVLWQKERLLNLALEMLPNSCRNVAWLDCDFIFDDPNWAAAAQQALDEVPMVQLFESWNSLAFDAEPPFAADDVETQRQSVASHYAAEGRLPRASPSRATTYAAWGGAWAGRRDLIEQYGFYDGCIIGGGDMAMFCAAVGEFQYVIERQQFNPSQERHYLNWARKFHAAVAGRVGHLKGSTFHLWHGDLEDRRYRQRATELARHGFDPGRDIAIASNGCWRWTTDNDSLRQCIHDYFVARNEDAQPLPTQGFPQ